MACSLAGTGGPRKISADRNKDGHRTYKVAHVVEGAPGSDGPYEAMNASGLPVIGSFWNFLGDSDLFAYCTPECKVSVHKQPEGHPPKFWLVEQTFSTVPIKRCQDDSIEDPLLEPQKISGSFAKSTEQARFDKDGDPILTSTYEPITGPDGQFDVSYPTVHIEQNVASLGLATFAAMVNTVNDSTLWGCSARCIKLSNASWERLIYGTCNFYYKRSFDFEVNTDTWDRTVSPKCEMSLGHWSSSNNAAATWVNSGVQEKYIAKGSTTHPGQPAKAVMDANGKPWDGTGTIPSISIQKYTESDFTLLGIPISL